MGDRESAGGQLLRSLGALPASLFESVAMRVRLWTAEHRRSRLGSVTFIGVTGSSGKTTAKDLIAKVLSLHSPGRKTGGSANELHDVARAIRLIRPEHRFLVAEVGAPAPGVIDRCLALLRPRVGVVTNIGTDHISAYGSAEGIAAEKRKLVQALPPDGIAVLNADDPRVRAMAEGFQGRVISYGLDPSADLRAEDVTSVWPSRLSFTLVHAHRRITVETQLCGRHWVSSVLAALAVGLALGVPLEEGARALAHAAPFEGRMSPVSIAGEVTFIRDDWKASIHTIPPALDFMKEAVAPRKIVVIGTIADTTGDAGAVYVTMARRAAEAADIVCFVGPRSTAALRAKRAAGDDRIRAFASTKAASDFLGEVLRPGDLVLLKGSNTADHLCRILLVRVRRVRCWRDDCKRVRFCDTCELIEVDSASVPSAAAPPEPLAERAPASTEAAPSVVIVGLGNPGERYRDTPHNVGQAVLDRLAARLSLEWRDTPDGHLSRGLWNGRSVCLVKPSAFMNHTGPALRAIAARLGVGHEQCVLVYDDHDLPLGAVRRRQRGSDGGHRGVRSIIEAFQTDEFRRVKVGVRRPASGAPAGDAVLAPFDATERETIRDAYDEAIARLDVLLAEPVNAARGAS
ncbi:MAG TPA: aminoacyl-tRNA hydrolase [Methylomirabilota bacterium]|nr:aminoacyl-tRNA hydrolase [Methylomirabilota bacterium]